MNADKLAEALRTIRDLLVYQQVTPLVASLIATCDNVLAEYDAQPAQAAQPVGVPDGWVTVPKIPTPEMADAARRWQVSDYVSDPLGDRRKFYNGVYWAMLHAAPQPPAQPSAYCLACQSAGMRNCQHFDECSGATCATCHRPLNDIKQPSADAEDAGVHEFIKDIATQAPEKPDYWSTCGQCERNIQRAQELLDAARAAEGDGK